MMGTKYVTVVEQEQYAAGPFCFDGPLDAVIDSLIAIRNSIPEEYRASAMCSIASVSDYEDSHHASIEVTYTR